jgi:hypothetical protein
MHRDEELFIKSKLSCDLYESFESKKERGLELSFLL